MGSDSTQMSLAARGGQMMERWCRWTGDALVEPVAGLAQWLRDRHLLGPVSNDYETPQAIADIGRRGRGRDLARRIGWRLAEGTAMLGWTVASVVVSLGVASALLAATTVWGALQVVPLAAWGAVAAGEHSMSGLRRVRAARVAGRATPDATRAGHEVSVTAPQEHLTGRARSVSSPSEPSPAAARLPERDLGL